MTTKVDRLFKYVSIRVVPVSRTIDSAVFNVELDDETIIAIAVAIDKEDRLQLTSGSDLRSLPNSQKAQILGIIQKAFPGRQMPELPSGFIEKVDKLYQASQYSEWKVSVSDDVTQDTFSAVIDASSPDDARRQALIKFGYDPSAINVDLQVTIQPHHRSDEATVLTDVIGVMQRRRDAQSSNIDFVDTVYGYNRQDIGV